MFDLVMQNARIGDGTGQPGFMETLGVQNGRSTHPGRRAGLAAKLKMWFACRHEESE